MSLAVTKFQVVAKSDPSKKTKKIKYGGFGCTKKLNLNELRDFDVELGTILMAEIDVMGDSVMVTRLMTVEEYANEN